LTKDVEVDVLARALRGAYAGEAVVSRRFGMKLVEHLRHTPQSRVPGPHRGPLTSREWEVMDLVSERCSTAEIADAMGLGSETVRSHIKHILRKLDVRSRDEAIVAAARVRRATPPDPAA
jgi:DNA-binding NarL/FixJ family response regulator